MDEFPSLLNAFERFGIQLWEVHLYSDAQIASRVNRSESEVARFRQAYLDQLEQPQIKPVSTCGEPINTGIDSLNTLLGGGLYRGTVTELFGASGAGKTCFCCQLALANPNTVYILTENNSHVIKSRMDDIVAARHDDLETKDSIKFQKISTASALRVYLNLLVRNGTEAPVVIIDSLTPLFPDVRGDDVEHRTLMADLELRRIALSLNCAIFLTNQVRDTRRREDNAPIYSYERQVEIVEGDAGLASQDRKRPAHGFVIADYVDTRLMIVRPDFAAIYRRIYLSHSRYAAPGVVHASLGESGIVEDEEVEMDESSLVSVLSQ